MVFFEPTLCSIDVEAGLMANGNGHYKKTFADLNGLYSDQAAYDSMLAERADEVVYEVTSYTAGDRVNDLIVGVTRMSPGKVGEEFFLTRGHIHANPDRPEMYHCQSGHGLMLMESPDGKVRILELTPNAICYVPPFWIHRSVNVGETDFVMLFAYPGDSGQDYSIIEASGGMRVRIVDDGKGGWKQVDNAGYKPRSSDIVDDLLAKSA